MKLELIDTHCHLQFSAFDKDRELAISRALKNGVGVINVGTDKKSSREAVNLALENDGFWAAVGLHPTEKEEFDWDFFYDLAKNPKVAAIGETGLDYYRIKDRELRIEQRELFLKHIELANKVKKPLIIHCRDAHDDMFSILDSKFKTLDSISGVMHFFTGNYRQAKQYIDLGFYISLSGVITFVSEYEELVKKLPLERILIETDAPFAAPVPYRGRRNEPAYVVEMAKKIAEIKSLSFEEVALATTKNASEVFKIPV